MTPAGLDLLRLARTEGVGPITFRRLRAQFPEPAEALAALPEMARRAGRALRPASREAVLREIEALRRLGGRFVFLGDPLYPLRLAALGDSPPVFAVLGDPGLLGSDSVALVGARNASSNGRTIARVLARGFAETGHVVVSGLARGIDAAAHEAALEAGRTVAVVAGGLDHPYPPEHAALQARIAAAGCVVAEMPLGTIPQARHFPRRNRIVAGLTQATVVIEAAPRSGSLITARIAAEAGREVFAVPGSPLDPRCRGSNDLLRQGAFVAESAEDVVRQLLDQRQFDLARRTLAEAATPVPRPPPSDTERAQVLALLGPDPCSVDDLARDCQLPASTLLTVLAELELGGRLEMLPGQRVALMPGAREQVGPAISK